MEDEGYSHLLKKGYSEGQVSVEPLHLSFPITLFTPIKFKKEDGFYIEIRGKSLSSPYCYAGKSMEEAVAKAKEVAVEYIVSCSVGKYYKDFTRCDEGELVEIVRD
jgi:hypothetical protein